MTELFSNLVSRSMSRGENAQSAAILRPRLPSLFETPAGTEGMADSLTGRRHNPDQGEAELPLRGFSSDQDMPFAKGETSPGLFEQDVPFPLAARGDTSPHRRPQSGQWSDTDASGEGNDRPESALDLRHSMQRTVRPLPPELDDARAAGLTVDPPGTVAAARLSMESGRQPGREGVADARETLSPIVGRYKDAPEDAPAASIEPLGLKTNDISGADPLADQYGQSTEKASAPTIHITIGRIEVRAVHQPAAQPAPRPVRQQPRLGLDDYLRQRSEGKR